MSSLCPGQEVTGEVLEEAKRLEGGGIVRAVPSRAVSGWGLNTAQCWDLDLQPQTNQHSWVGLNGAWWAGARWTGAWWVQGSAEAWKWTLTARKITSSLSHFLTFACSTSPTVPSPIGSVWTWRG